MFATVMGGVLQGLRAEAVTLWQYAITHPWLPGLVALIVALKVIELRVRRRRPRRR